MAYVSRYCYYMVLTKHCDYDGDNKKKHCNVWMKLQSWHNLMGNMELSPTEGTNKHSIVCTISRTATDIAQSKNKKVPTFVVIGEILVYYISRGTCKTWSLFPLSLRNGRTLVTDSQFCRPKKRKSSSLWNWQIVIVLLQPCALVLAQAH